MDPVLASVRALQYGFFLIICGIPQVIDFPPSVLGRSEHEYISLHAIVLTAIELHDHVSAWSAADVCRFVTIRKHGFQHILGAYRKCRNQQNRQCKNLFHHSVSQLDRTKYMLFLIFGSLFEFINQCDERYEYTQNAHQQVDQIKILFQKSSYRFHLIAN